MWENHAPVENFNMSFNLFREKKILTKIFEFTVSSGNYPFSFGPREKPVFGVSYKVRLKPVWSAIESS